MVAVVLEAETGRVWSLEANAKAPAAAREDMHDILSMRERFADVNENEYGCSVTDDANVFGPLAVPVSGQLAGTGTLSEKWGRLPRSEIVAPLSGFGSAFFA